MTTLTENDLHDSCRQTLDRLLRAAQAGLAAPALLALIDQADHWRRTAPARWRQLAAEVLARHPIASLAAHCPMTERARAKPRGYAGDALMLDYIYDRRAVAADRLDGLEREVFRVVADSPACASVDYRRQVIAARIDALAQQRAAEGLAPPAVLSLACGHAREFDLVHALAAGQLGPVALCDQDPLSLAELRRRLPHPALQTYPLTVRSFLTRKTATLGRDGFDLVYSAGLYDYLDDATATRLTQALFAHLAPGGQLLLANFHPDTRGCGYMEAFMDWWLIYRNEEQMRALPKTIDPQQLAEVRVDADPFGNVVYLSVTRR